jgi:hypothetical protein
MISKTVVLAATVLGVLCSTPSAARTSFFARAYGPDARALGSVAFSNVPDDAQIAELIRSDADTVYRISWSCRAASTGRLQGCTVQRASPNDIDLQQVGGILASLRISRKDAALLRRTSGTLEVTALIDDPRRRLNQDCPPGWCPVTPPPRPPGS